jgi:hypothetical protein
MKFNKRLTSMNVARNIGARLARVTVITDVGQDAKGRQNVQSTTLVNSKRRQTVEMLSARPVLLATYNPPLEKPLAFRVQQVGIARSTVAQLVKHVLLVKRVVWEHH